MAFDDACHVWHAAVTEPDIEFFPNLVEPTVRAKVFDRIERIFGITFNFDVV